MPIRYIETHDNIEARDEDTGALLAELGPHFLRVPKYLVFYPGCPETAREEVMRWASEKLPMPSCGWTDVEPAQRLGDYGVKVMDLVLATVEDAVAAALDVVKVPSLRFELGARRIGGDLELHLRVGREHRFEFWKACDSPRVGANEMWRLDITPAYHPCMTEGDYRDLINGDTDCLIGGTSVRYVECPRASMATREDGRRSSTSWSHVKHPYCAVGRRLTVRVDPNVVRTARGIADLVLFLRCALRLDGYIAVSGGFRPPLRSPHNRLIDLGRGRPWGECRGSEASAVWQYRTLEREGVLAGSIVPKWLHSERWLETYAGAEVKHGLY